MIGVFLHKGANPIVITILFFIVLSLKLIECCNYGWTCTTTFLMCLGSFAKLVWDESNEYGIT